MIRKFRCECGSFDKVEKAAFSFLRYLNEFGKSSPAKVKTDSLRNMVDPLLKSIAERFQQRVSEFVAGEMPKSLKTIEEVQAYLATILEDALKVFERIIGSAKDASFVGDGPIVFGDEVLTIISERVDETLKMATDEQKHHAIELVKLYLKKGFLTDGYTGLVVAGFGANEIFPTLVSFEIDGMVSDRIKFIQTNYVDIDRGGPRAKVLPFAQREMVERFLYGLDERIQNNVVGFVENNVTTIRESMLSGLEFQDEASRDLFTTHTMAAEAAFVGGLRQRAFEVIRTQSEAEIEGMVEFMPKPELAKMAEALET